VVLAQATAFIQEHHRAGVLCTLKHFPGHGSSTQDSHVGLADITRTWTETELLPFQRLIDAGLADMVMAGHLFNAKLDPAYPASLSRPVISDLLRGQLSYDGVVMTDDMGMGAITDFYGFGEAIELAVNAGVDLLSFAAESSYTSGVPGPVQVILDGVAAGRISEARVTEAYRRVVRLKARLLAA
jgi:beta-N-acetylhexosaminidase